MKTKILAGGLLADGTAIIPTRVLTDRKITVEAKAIYSYFAAYAERPEPPLNKVLKDLNMGEQRFFKHREQLLDRGYIRIN